MKKKILFLIHDLGQGGAEKVLINLVNNMDLTKYQITVMALFGGGINEKFLKKTIHYKVIFPKMIPGNSKWMKLFTPEQLHTLYIKERYDIEIAYLEGPSARIISGCTNQDTNLIAWIHVEQHTMKKLSSSFRNDNEAELCYKKFDKIICVSEYIKTDLCKLLDCKNKCEVLYNTVDSEEILSKSQECVKGLGKKTEFCLIAVGTLKESKGYERLLNIVLKLKEEGYRIHLFILGIGPLEEKLKQVIIKNSLADNVSLLGYDVNPYKYVAKSDLFVCASYAEGFSTATTEALIVGTPVCTVNVSGMKEMLGNNNEYGIVVDNNTEALYQGIKRFLDEPELLTYYREKARERGEFFNKENTVNAVEDMLEKLC